MYWWFNRGSFIRALEVLPLPRHFTSTENYFYLRNPGCPKYFLPLHSSIPVLYCISVYKVCLAVVSVWTLCALLFTSSNTPSPTSPSKHHFCRSWSVSLLQSRQSPPLNTPHFLWKATLTYCSATWPAPTVLTRRATGWRTGRRSRKHAATTGTLSTSKSHGRTLYNLCVCRGETSKI